MTTTITPRQLRALLAQETNEVFLTCVTIDHPSFESPYRLVDDTKNLVRASGTFEPFAFTLNLPDQSEDSVPQVQMSIDNVDNKILLAVRTLPAGVRPSMTIEVVTASEPDARVAGPLEFTVLSIDYDEASITATLGVDDNILNVILGDIYTPTNSPGMFL